MDLNYEQLNWICNITKDERDRIISLLKTGKWVMEWNDEEHAFVMRRAEKTIDLLAAEEQKKQEG